MRARYGVPCAGSWHARSSRPRGASAVLSASTSRSNSSGRLSSSSSVRTKYASCASLRVQNRRDSSTCSSACRRVSAAAMGAPRVWRDGCWVSSSAENTHVRGTGGVFFEPKPVWHDHGGGRQQECVACYGRSDAVTTKLARAKAEGRTWYVKRRRD